MLTIQLGALSMQASAADVAPTALDKASRAAQAGASRNSPGQEQKRGHKAEGQSEWLMAFFARIIISS